MQACFWLYRYLPFQEWLSPQRQRHTGVCAGTITMTEDGKFKKQGKSLQSRADVRLFTYLSVVG